jgi:hypothetical protein
MALLLTDELTHYAKLHNKGIDGVNMPLILKEE